jgi:hypothetical protein
MILGGRDTGRYFDDTHVLDTATLSWTHVRGLKNPGAPCRICSHVAEGLHSVPSYKLFSFGGQTGSDKSRCEWSYRDKVRPRQGGLRMRMFHRVAHALASLSFEPCT